MSTKTTRMLRTPLLAAACLVALPACTYQGDPPPTTRPSTRPGDPQLADPTGKWRDFDASMRDISGGDINNYNKDAMKRDLDRFWMK
jgi:hypothetical protein